MKRTETGEQTQTSKEIELASFFRSFGEAVFQAQRLEYDLVSLLLLVQRLGDILISREHLLSCEERYMRQTLGQLLNQLQRRIQIGPEIEIALSEALSNRNYLIHKFFAQDSDNLRSSREISSIIGKVGNACNSIEKADAIVHSLISLLSPIVGISDKEFSKEIRKFLSDSSS